MKKLTVLLVCVAASFAQMWSQVTISLENFHIQRGEDIVVSYSNGAGNDKDYIGIAPLGQLITGIPGGYTTTYAYLDNPGAKEGICTIPANNMGATGDGYYWAVYLLNDGYDAASEYIPFYYGESAPQNESPVLTVDECTVDYTTITFTDNELWRMLIKEINVDGEVLSPDDYAIEAGALYVLKDLTSAGSLTIIAWDHSDATVQLGNSSSIDEASILNGIRFYNNVLYVANGQSAIQSVSVFSLTGALSATYPVGMDENTIDLSHLNGGVYIVKVNGAVATKAIKIVVKH